MNVKNQKTAEITQSFTRMNACFHKYQCAEFLQHANSS